MDNEVPCRDTDPVNMNLVNKTADTMAFTIDFGQEEINKVLKLIRYVLHSSFFSVIIINNEKKLLKSCIICNPEHSGENLFLLLMSLYKINFCFSKFL